MAMDPEQRELWMQMRRALLLMVRAIEEQCQIERPREQSAPRR